MLNKNIREQIYYISFGFKSAHYWKGWKLIAATVPTPYGLWVIREDTKEHATVNTIEEAYSLINEL